MIQNLRAFLDMLSVSEGTKGIGDDGYNVLVGSTVSQPILFGSYKDHPRIRVQLNETLISSAAGRYQILARYFDAYRKSLSLPDFSPASQDRIAIQLINECHAYDYILAGHLEIAIGKCKSRWASLPGAGYGQWEHSFADLRTIYLDQGGTLS